MEDPIPEMRVCDEAYLNLRLLLHTGEKPDDQVDSASIFRRLEPEMRDTVIRKYTKSGVWANLFEAEHDESSHADPPPPPRSME